ncbi:hypothetical protein J6590_012839 [Homalodisca vitripennis]|nr:hypothetical protein J6590_012839 [Homalodisca vitripennis]
MSGYKSCILELSAWIWLQDHGPTLSSNIPSVRNPPNLATSDSCPLGYENIEGWALRESPMFFEKTPLSPAHPSGGRSVRVPRSLGPLKEAEPVIERPYVPRRSLDACVCTILPNTVHDVLYPTV